MKLIVILLVAVVVIIVLLRWRRPPGKAGRSAIPETVARAAASEAKAKAAPSSEERPHLSVSIKPGPGACEAAQALAGKRILAAEATSLPLPDCTTSGCSCKFERHDDRRETDGDQRALAALSTDLYQTSGNAERRSKKGRRKQDSQ